MRRFFLLFFICTIFLKLNALEDQKLSCIILLDQEDSENIGVTSRFYLMSKLQSSLTEQAAPLLVHASLWNSFIERRVSFEQNAQQVDTKEHKLLTLHHQIKERLLYWSNYYNGTSDDISQNKTLVAQRINEEFYDVEDKLVVSDMDYQLLLNYLTPFDPKEWCIYKKNGFYLLLPKKYRAQHSSVGFKLDSLEEIAYSEDIASNYFEAQDPYSLVNALPDFFLTYKDLPNQIMPYTWNIVISGHGGSKYKEKNNNKTITWAGEPCIADLNLQEFKEVLEFFQTQLKTQMLHYSSCYAGGNHIELAFEKDQKQQIYDFAIICECLTDCSTYCKWGNLLPSSLKPFLTADDLIYDSAIKNWDLVIKSPYEWEKFFNCISKIDFSIESMDRLPKILSYITYPIIANISLLRRPGINNFYPLTSSGIIKVDDRFMRLENEHNKDDSITLHGAKVLLLESDYIPSTLKLDNTDKIRIISTKPGNALHYIKKLNSENHIDLPSTFWQAEFQLYNKTFLIDECVFPYSDNSPVFRDVAVEGIDIVLKNVIITQQNNFCSHFIRWFFTINDISMMVVAKKLDPHELDESTTIQEIIILSPEARGKYEEYYLSLKDSFNERP